MIPQGMESPLYALAGSLPLVKGVSDLCHLGDVIGALTQFGDGVAAGVAAGAKAAELAEARPRTRSGSPLPSWAAWSRT